jgi:C-terminal processing protease CtpA/Prc
MAWTDKDGRILVMTLPIYQPNATYTQLNTDNELGEPMDGSNSNLLWSPGGRYLAVEHQARNQFSIITIVDCGDPGDDKQMNDISLGRHVQATPNRFNSYRMAWGKSSIDYYLRDKLEMVAMLTGNDPPDDVATTLYFLTDRDVVTDVGSPWGNRAPAPHFSAQRSVWALPLIPVMAEGEVLEPFLGRFAGGGALELFIDDLGAFKRFVDEIANAVEAAGKGEGDERRRRARYLRAQTDDLVRQLRSRKLKASEAASLHRFLMLAMDETGRGTKESKTYSNVKDMGKRRVRLTSQNGKPTTSANVSQVSISSVTSPTYFPGDENSSLDATESKFPKDMSIDFGKADLSFARKAYRMSHIPKAVYIAVASQTNDDGSLVLVELAGGGVTLKLFSPSTFPSDKVDAIPISVAIDNFGLSTDRNHAWVVLTPDGKTKVIENTVSGWSSLPDEEKNVADASQLGISIFPSQEYQQMFNDAWRLLRDYFYDYKMHGVDWPSIHERYRDLVERCTKREELDDVLAQMASELSALHVFVYGGEYNSPIDEEDQDSFLMVTPGNLGVSLTRDPHWKGYRVSEIPNQDPDFNLMDDYPTFCPLCDQTLRLSGQKGLEVGDVIVAINGDSVMQVPDIHMLLRGTIGRSVRLEVLRLSSGAGNNTVQAKTESIITSPISPSDAASLFYNAWEWKTRETAKRLAAKAGFSVAYIHMKSMLQDDENAFARGFFPDYDAQALILDVRHNNGGNIDSWILTMLQRKAWMYWQGRTGMRRGDSDWDEQFAFRGHIVVLIDEMTASDGEGVSRGISELGLGRLIGTRTWGGGIWLASDNQLVDGGIATAPEIGTFNDNFGWGLGIEQHGVVPDIEVDNNPRTSFDGKDTQLETAIKVLEKWLVEEPVVIPNPPKNTMDMSVHGDSCRA